MTDPTVDLVTPSDGVVYERGQVVPARYTCGEELNGSGIDTTPRS